MPPPLAGRVEQETRSERFRQEQDVAGTGAALRPDAVGMNGSDDGEAVLRLLVAQRVPAREDSAGRGDLIGCGGEDRRDRLVREALRKRGDREREQRHAAHREDVVQRIRRGDPAVESRVVDERREEIDGEDERPVRVQPVDRGIVGRSQADEQVLGVGRHEPLHELLEPRGRELGGAATALREVGQPDGAHRPNLMPRKCDDREGTRSSRSGGGGTAAPFAAGPAAPAAGLR